MPKITLNPHKQKNRTIVRFQSVDKIQVLFLRRLRRICVFSLTRAAKKHLVSEKPLIQRFFKGTGVVLAGIECSPKISDFRANGIPVQERVDFFDTLRPPYKIGGLLFSISKGCQCGAGVRWTPLQSRSTDRAGRRDRRKARGNPSFLLKGYGFFRAMRSE